MKRTSFKRKKPDAKALADKQLQREKDIAFYEEIWKERKHVCVSCGIELQGEPSTANFDHILEKSKYQHLRYEKENICILCINCHSLKTNGFATDKYKQIIQQTKKKYEV